MGEIFRHMVEIFRLDLMLQIGLATLLGGAIGLERELGGKPAGLRTNILICIGSVLYTHLSLAMLTGSTGAIPPGTDTTRVAAQIVTGVGFIGAGTILHARGAVVGLTSAATIWVVAAIGVALGSGYYLEGVGTTLAVVVVLAGLGRVEKLVERQSLTSTISIHARPGPTVVEDLETAVRRMGLDILKVSNRQENVDLVVEFELRGSKRLYDQAIITLLHHDHVRTVSTGE
ncbi:MAG TPA: MgtC/SapB family protein [Gemmatimonadales bacterium]|nr:MgtC/SapB family protein [Gemmatimonadales bacterium]